MNEHDPKDIPPEWQNSGYSPSPEEVPTHEAINEAALTAPANSGQPHESLCAEQNDIAELPTYNPHQFDYVQVGDQGEKIVAKALDSGEKQQVVTAFDNTVADIFRRNTPFAELPHGPYTANGSRAAVLSLESETTDGRAVITLGGVTGVQDHPDMLMDPTASIVLVPYDRRYEPESFEYKASNGALVRRDISAAEMAAENQAIPYSAPGSKYGTHQDTAVIEETARNKAVQEMGLAPHEVRLEEIQQLQVLLENATLPPVSVVELADAFTERSASQRDAQQSPESAEDILDMAQTASRFTDTVRTFLERKGMDLGRRYQSSQADGEEYALTEVFEYNGLPYVSIGTHVEMDAARLQHLQENGYPGDIAYEDIGMLFTVMPNDTAEDPHPILAQHNAQNEHLLGTMSYRILGPDKKPYTLNGPPAYVRAQSPDLRIIAHYLENPALQPRIEY